MKTVLKTVIVPILILSFHMQVNNGQGGSYMTPAHLAKTVSLIQNPVSYNLTVRVTPEIVV